MAGFCEYCGEWLEDGQVCVCRGSQAKEASFGAAIGEPSAPLHNEPAAGSVDSGLVAETGIAEEASSSSAPMGASIDWSAASAPAPERQPVQFGQSIDWEKELNPSAASPTSPQSGAKPEIKVVAGGASQQESHKKGAGAKPFSDGTPALDLSAVFAECKTVVQDMVKDPAAAWKWEKSISSNAVYGLLIAQALSVAVFLAFSSWRIYLAYMGFGGGYFFGSVIQSLLYGFAQVASLLGALLLVAMLMHVSLEPQEALAKMAVCSPPWTAAYLCSALLVILLGGSSFGYLLYNTLFAFARVCSLLLLDGTLRDKLERPGRRILFFSCAYACQLFIVRLLNIVFSESGLFFASLPY